MFKIPFYQRLGLSVWCFVLPHVAFAATPTSKPTTSKIKPTNMAPKAPKKNIRKGAVPPETSRLQPDGILRHPVGKDFWKSYDLPQRCIASTPKGKGKSKNGYHWKCYKNGRWKLAETWMAGKRLGPFFHWYENGNLAWQGTYLKNKQFSSFRGWYQNGKPAWKLNYNKNGKPHGYSYRWHKSGSIAVFARWKQGYICNHYFTWNAQGKPKPAKIEGILKRSKCQQSTTGAACLPCPSIIFKKQRLQFR